MRVIVNGEQREINAASVDALLAELDYEGSHFAIALNYDVVPKSRWAETALKAGDEIEIITPRQEGDVMTARALLPSSRRRPGPITTTGYWRKERRPACLVEGPRRMGPGLRRDDGTV